jgi:hypothetical protein
MKKAAFLLAFSLLVTGSLAAQTTEFGVLFGGSKRVVKHGAAGLGTETNPGFKFSNSSFDLYYAVEVDPATLFKVQVGRIDGPVAFKSRQQSGANTVDVRSDANGQVQHAEGTIEYRFSEPFGSTGLFAGVGIYRTTATGFTTSTTYGFPIGVTADFPLSRRYGVIAAATYHIVNSDFRPRYLTASAGLRIGF